MASQSPAPKRGLGRILVTLLVGLAVAAGVFYFVALPHPLPKPKPVLVQLGTYVTNLNDPAVTHYIKVSIAVLVSSSEDARLLAADNTAVQSAVLATLQGITVTEAVGSHAIAAVGRRVAQAVEANAPGVRVLRVYFTQFIVE